MLNPVLEPSQGVSWLTRPFTAFVHMRLGKAHAFPHSRPSTSPRHERFNSKNRNAEQREKVDVKLTADVCSTTRTRCFSRNGRSPASCKRKSQSLNEAAPAVIQKSSSHRTIISIHSLSPIALFGFGLGLGLSLRFWCRYSSCSRRRWSEVVLWSLERGWNWRRRWCWTAEMFLGEHGAEDGGAGCGVHVAN